MGGGRPLNTKEYRNRANVVSDFQSRIEKYVPFKSILQRKLFSYRRNFKQCKLSILKCSFGTKLLISLRFFTGWFPSFFLTRNKLLKNWCVVCRTFLTVPLFKISWISSFTKISWFFESVYFQGIFCCNGWLRNDIL